jgi:hypothetical protein
VCRYLCSLYASFSCRRHHCSASRTRGCRPSSARPRLTASGSPHKIKYFLYNS